MTIVSMEPDLGSRTLTINAEFDAPVERVWQLWADPRRLERWWGPPTYPAAVGEHDLVPGGRVSYFMTGPEGDRHGGWWSVTAVDPPRRLEFDDGFADESGAANLDLPVTHIVVTLSARAAGGTNMTIVSTFGSVEAMEQLIAMGVDEGMRAAMGQMDAVLAA